MQFTGAMNVIQNIFSNSAFPLMHLSVKNRWHFVITTAGVMQAYPEWLHLNYYLL